MKHSGRGLNRGAAAVNSMRKSVLSEHIFKHFLEAI